MRHPIPFQLAIVLGSFLPGFLPGGGESAAIPDLPDPFLKSDGTRIGSREEWPEQRKRLLEEILRCEYGPLPPAPEGVKASETAARPIEPAGSTEKEILLATGPGGSVSAHLILSIPPGKGPFPAIIRGDLCWKKVDPAIVAEVLKRGYILADFNREDIAPDSAERKGVYEAYPGYDGGRLAAWAWGFHRIVDYLVTLDVVDRKRIAVTGHSRGGKTALLAGATDERIALTAPNNSGCGGAGSFKLLGEKCEDIGAILKNFPFWFHPKFGEYIGHVDRLPFDQHTLKACVAPRALLSTEALGDLWANPKGTQATHLAAKEVFEFLGAGEKIGIAFREGKHEQNADDWTVLLDFADRQLLGKTVGRRFDSLAFPGEPRGYSWKAPGAPAR